MNNHCTIETLAQLKCSILCQLYEKRRIAPGDDPPGCLGGEVTTPLCTKTGLLIELLNYYSPARGYSPMLYRSAGSHISIFRTPQILTGTFRIGTCCTRFLCKHFKIYIFILKQQTQTASMSQNISIDELLYKTVQGSPITCTTEQKIQTDSDKSTWKSVTTETVTTEQIIEKLKALPATDVTNVITKGSVRSRDLLNLL